LLSSKFRIDRILGAGGMGVVVAAHHRALDRRVAIKLMRPELRTRGDVVRRFLREARAAARLTSRHATRVFDVDTLEDGAPYIVMEYLDGIDLATWLAERGPVAASRAAAIVAQASHAIAEAHAAGIVHRDLKPANLFMTRDAAGAPIVKVLDLGVCKLVGRGDGMPDTSLTAALGTPEYMAPEQLSASHRADARSDIWSLGVILYELVAGCVPFRGRTPAELRPRVACDLCPPLAGVPDAFAAVIARCLAKDPSARFPCAGELLAVLAPFAPDALPSVASLPRGRRWLPAGAVLVALASVGWGLGGLLARAPAAAAPQAASPPGTPRSAPPVPRVETASRPDPTARPAASPPRDAARSVDATPARSASPSPRVRAKRVAAPVHAAAAGADRTPVDAPDATGAVDPLATPD
jgi:serine/threonine-protein kinase